MPGPTYAIASSIGSRRGTATSRQSSIPALETALVALSGLNLCFLPWAFGGVDAWSQLISAALAGCALILALLHGKFYCADNRSDTIARRSLLRFPIFWAGLAFFLYLAIQALNPAYAYEIEGTRWWLVSLPHVTWLPSGMRVPFAEMNVWRSTLMWSTCWMITCALWLGISHRRSILWLTTILCANAFIFSAFGIVQRASGTTEVYGLRDVGFPYFFAAIIYKNHAAAFFGLLGCANLGLLAHTLRSRRSHAWAVLVLFQLVIALAVFLSFSFSGIVVFGLAMLVGLSAFLPLARGSRRSGRKMAAVATAGILFFLTATLGVASGFSDWQEKLHQFTSGEGEHSVKSRLMVARRGWEMFADRPVFGWGAGCFRYGFTKYQHRDPELVRWRHLRLRWEHVHDDWLEFLIELGLIGVLPLGFACGYWLRKITALQLWKSALAWPICCGLGALALYAFFDFPFQNLAVVATAGALLPLIVRWVELEKALPSPPQKNSPDR